MPLPLILGIAAAVAGVAGLGGAAVGVKNTMDASTINKQADEKYNKALESFEATNKDVSKKMDILGKKEMEILKSFDRFSKLMEKVKNKPEFKEINIGGYTIPKYDPEKLKEVAVGADTILNAAASASMGTLGGFAAAGATVAAVAALGTASTGTAIAGLSGAAATNAILAALGGGALAAGGGGIALGSTILGVSTAGIGLLVGGVIFALVSGGIKGKAENAAKEKDNATAKIYQIIDYLRRLRALSTRYCITLDQVDSMYKSHLERLSQIIQVDMKTDWNDFTEKEKLMTENLVLLVSLLYNMCTVKLVIPAQNENDTNVPNYAGVNTTINKVNSVFEDRGWV